MPRPPLSNEVLTATVEAYNANDRSWIRTAQALGIGERTVGDRLKQAAKRGLLLDHPPAKPGFEITKITTAPDGGQHITEKLEHGDVFKMPKTHFLGKMTVNRDASGRVIQDWIRAEVDDVAREAAMRAAVAAFSSEIPRAEPVHLNLIGNADLVNQYTVTDYHFGMLSWKEETGGDWDLKIAEKLWINWFAAAIRQSPDAEQAILAQLGDLLHFDSLKAITPAHGHILDADSRFAKIVRVVIRCMRAAVRMLLEKHDHLHLIMADANHDEASEVWLREMFAAHFEDEPRITIDRTPGTYYAYEWGLTSLFYHHGHKKKMKDVDSTWVGRYREIYGRTKFAYGHTGHLHSDELISTNLMKVERHETLAAPSAFEANGGYNSGRSAKVITYSKRFGEVGRVTLTPEMVAA
ncbi:hypothetical protein [Bradyrhizobium erythrophlei]|uniref:Uncharacterized protein n=1 Tax=Bradyrhizobium erythrophlei TaxID=1437360 RepID=A0A1M5NUQ1_9BRAD|nr:hypothetical protein [Bradyrhizobium erythrophlei]SHG92683.1 hypothetical protein SAMN05443248_3105 [Bradyrhizobium erythrophlei]